MRLHQLNPILDARWARFVERHPRASVFHTVAWLKALQCTYGYEPVVFTASAPTEELHNALVFCRIKSWLTGSRLVSLPFSDHCEPLCDSTQEVDRLVRTLQAAPEYQKWKYLEIRPIHGNFGGMGQETGFVPAAQYYLHALDLSPKLDVLFKSLDKNSVQRRIARARRAGLIEKCGTSNQILNEFYTLFIITRRRHHLPPIPYAWFRNLIDCLGPAIDIRMAYKDGIPVAAILILQFRNVVYYKYGCSDTQFNKLGAMPWLLWGAIASGKSAGASQFDMGRTQEDNVGLLTFKNHWVSDARRLVYWRSPGTTALDSAHGWKLKMAKNIFSHLPNWLLVVAGRLMYRHIG